MAPGEALPKTSDKGFSATRMRVPWARDRRPTGSTSMTKRSNQFRQSMRPATSDRRVRLHIGRFAGDAWAVISQCRTYRYRLVRVWDSHLPRLGVVGHSWSTTNGWRSDPTVRRCIGFARTWGYGGVDIGSLFGLQGADPTKLASVADPVGPDNDAHLAKMCADNDLVLLAWGAHADPNRARAVAQMLWRLSEYCGGSLAVLGWTERGQPCHPLCVPKHATPDCLTLGVAGYGLHEAEDPRWERLLASEA
jgi:hypothetical protein